VFRKVAGPTLCQVLENRLDRLVTVFRLKANQNK
jgi:hypothetical protein